MGQKLNIEIVTNEEVLANAYYHWSAYTGSALSLTNTILETYDKLEKSLEPHALAIRLLESTGAGANEIEKVRIQKDGRFMDLKIQDARDRNHGFIAITSEGIRETESWEEGRVTVNIEEETIIFGVYMEYSTFKDWSMDYFDDDELDKAKYEYTQFPEIDYRFETISFDDLCNLRKVYEQSLTTFGYKRPDGSVVCWTE